MDLDKKLYAAMLESYQKGGVLKDDQSLSNQESESFIYSLSEILFPIEIPSEDQLLKSIHSIKTLLVKVFSKLEQKNALDESDKFLNSLPQIRNLLIADAQLFLEGDPAADSIETIIKAYPGFYAIMVYRISHYFYQVKAKKSARLLAELAHSKTGIDIHPGAKIQSPFMIDHGTGVVIGETAEIGKQVKIYQGVTLGALSVKKCESNAKRHPTIKDNVTIYAQATILGGETVVGECSVIGGNVWLIKSVPAHSKISAKFDQYKQV